ncbi:SCO family protein [Rhodohalobacter sp. 614A]|uniref:SCO family protein n=1 Tax=Rhodohalobacter sp. 614A TaxID=2908649 RepID=UPI001F1C77C8|nr:SCO family protein [Rhodohalobacter sp. 614A]
MIDQFLRYMPERYSPIPVLILLILFLFAGCRNNAIDDFSDTSFELINQNGETVHFPDDFEGAPMVMGFIYTNCPDICSFITANVRNVYRQMENPDNVQFILVTFDPQRDTPEVLKKYAQSFEMDQEPFQFLTADSSTIASFMERMSVRTQESYSEELDNGDRIYFLNHSDKILLIDEDSRLIFDYGGSMTSPNLIIEDLQKL